MNIKVEQFCSLATSPSLQTWLYEYNYELYRQFIHRLHESKGCTENRELMKELLEEIDIRGDGPSLSAFLSKHYPYMINDNPAISISGDSGDVFSHYNPNILTYPRRIIFAGPYKQLKKKVREFLLDKIKSDYLIINDRAYVEYLERKDHDIASQVPLANWQIAAYRQK